MTVMYPQTGPGTSPGRIVAALSGVVALIGFFSTLLPVLTVNAAAYGPVLDRLGGVDHESAARIDLSFGYYDWIAASQPAVGLIPVALALATAAGLLQALRGTDRAAQAVTLFCALAALVASALTAIRPAMSVQLTGALARHAGTDTSAAVGDSASGVSVAPTVALTAIALLVVVGLNAWQVLAERTQSVR